MDDRTLDGSVPDAGQAFNDAIQAAWKVAPSKAVAAEQKMEANLTTADDVLELYRFINQPSTLKSWIRADFGEALREPTDKHYGRHACSHVEQAAKSA